MEKSPIDPRLLEPCLRAFPNEARTLPAEAYLSDEVFAWEGEHLFASSWVCLGRAGALDQAGDQRAVGVGNDAILLVRAADGALRGLFNTCRHRGHELLSRGGAPTSDRVVRCPYHRWTYDLDGRFRGGPGLAAQEGFRRDDPGNDLVSARVEEWRGWVFANVSGDAADLCEHIGVFDRLIADYEPERLVIGVTHDYDVAANWKVLVENYHECYHCTEIHPELCAVSSPGNGADYEPSGTVIGGSMELLPNADTMSLDGKSLGVPFRKLEGASRREVHYLQVFPSLLLSIHPDYVMTHRLEPLAPGRTRIECAWLFPPEAREHPGFDPSYAADFWDLTNRQDWAACEAVQRGMAGRGYRQAPFSRFEHVVYQSMSLVARGYLQGRVRPVPRTTASSEEMTGSRAGAAERQRAEARSRHVE
jgi:Rieske 2Fe-2S family protein